MAHFAILSPEIVEDPILKSPLTSKSTTSTLLLVSNAIKLSKLSSNARSDAEAVSEFIEFTCAASTVKDDKASRSAALAVTVSNLFSCAADASMELNSLILLTLNASNVDRVLISAAVAVFSI